MKPVLHLVDNLTPGGCQTCLKALMEFPGKERPHYVFSLRYTEPSVEISGGNVICARGWSRFSPRPFGPLLRLVRDLGDPILHCHLFRAQGYGFLARKMHPRSPLILHERGRIVQREHEPAWERLAYRIFLRTARSSVDLVLANSRFTLGRLDEAGIHGRLPSRVIYNSILSVKPEMNSLRRREARDKYHLPPSTLVVGFAGRLVERKGWRDFLACAESFRERSDVTWLVAGGGADRAAVEHELSVRALSQVRFLGFEADMESFYQALDVCVIPSHWEPHGLVQIEAQARGVPVVVANVPGMSETVNDRVDALLFKPQDAEDLAARVRELLTSADLRTQLSVASIENAGRFTIEHYHEELESCYRLL